MFNKKTKSILLFMCGIFLFSILILNCGHAANLGNINYPYSSFRFIPFGF